MSTAFRSSKTFVVFEGGPYDIAFDALQIAALAGSEDWDGTEPLDLGPVLGEPRADSQRRVLLVETDGCDVPVVASGVMSIRTVPSDSVMPPAPDSDLPSCVEGVVSEGAHPLLVIRAASLSQMATLVANSNASRH